VLGDGARIGPDARIEGAILWERVEVGAGAVLQECVIGADVKIGDGARVEPEVILASGTIVPERATLTR
jgi:NDP-sugar pyrophosphorylase family protein